MIYSNVRSEVCAVKYEGPEDLQPPSKFGDKHKFVNA